MLGKRSVFTALALLSFGCGPSRQAADNTVVVNPRLAFVDRMGGDINVQVASGQLTFPAAGNDWLMARQPGDGLLCTFACPTPFLREVVSVSSDGTSYVVTTTDGNLADVWSEGDNVQTYLMSADDYRAAHPPATASSRSRFSTGLAGVSSSLTAQPAVTGQLKFGPYSIPPGAVGVLSASGTIDYTVRFPFNGSWSKSGISFSMGVEGTMDVVVTGSAQVTGKVSDTESYKFPMPALALGEYVIPFDPPLPVFPFVQGEANVSVTASGSMSVNNIQSTSHAGYSNGVQYDSGAGLNQWKSARIPDTFTTTASIAPDMTEMDTGTLSVSWGPGLFFTLNVVEPAGVGPSIELYSKTTADLQGYADCSKTPEAGVTADLKSELDVNAYASVTILGYTLATTDKALSLGKLDSATLWTPDYPPGLNAWPVTGVASCLCTIGNANVANQAVNPSNPCQVCAPSQIMTAWSNAPDGTPCPAGACLSGTCQTAPTGAGGAGGAGGGGGFVPPPSMDSCPTMNDPTDTCCDLQGQCSSSGRPCVAPFGPCCGRPAEDVGDLNANYDCQPAAFCIQPPGQRNYTGVCLPDPSRVAGLACGGGHDCAPGYGCQGNVCVPSDLAAPCDPTPPGTASTCPSPWTCLDGTGVTCTDSSALCWCNG